MLDNPMMDYRRDYGINYGWRNDSRNTNKFIAFIFKKHAPFQYSWKRQKIHKTDDKQYLNSPPTQKSTQPDPSKADVNLEQEKNWILKKSVYQQAWRIPWNGSPCDGYIACEILKKILSGHSYWSDLLTSKYEFPPNWSKDITIYYLYVDDAVILTSIGLKNTLRLLMYDYLDEELLIYYSKTKIFTFFKCPKQRSWNFSGSILR
ncbi:hypothetical protein L345_09659, partial [Ophiophagus hannah]